MPRVDQDVETLWAAVFGEPPPVTATPELMLSILVSHLPSAPPYRELYPTGADEQRKTTTSRVRSPSRRQRRSR